MLLIMRSMAEQKQLYAEAVKEKVRGVIRRGATLKQIRAVEEELLKIM